MHKPNMFLLPPAPDKCQECAVKHDLKAPHNRDSLYYQYYFYGKHGRWPTWEDAMAHCDAEIKKAITELLESKNIAWKKVEALNEVSK